MRSLFSILVIGMSAAMAAAQTAGGPGPIPPSRVLAGVREYPAEIQKALVVLADHADWHEKLANQLNTTGELKPADDMPADLRGAVNQLREIPDAMMIAISNPQALSELKRLKTESPDGASARLSELRSAYDREQKAAAADWQDLLSNDAIALGQYREFLTKYTDEQLKEFSDFAVVEVLDREYYKACPPNEPQLIDKLLNEGPSPLKETVQRWAERHDSEVIDYRIQNAQGPSPTSVSGELLIDAPASRRQGMWRAASAASTGSVGKMPVILQPASDQPQGARIARSVIEHGRLWLTPPLEEQPAAQDQPALSGQVSPEAIASGVTPSPADDASTPLVDERYITPPPSESAALVDDGSGVWIDGGEVYTDDDIGVLDGATYVSVDPDDYDDDDDVEIDIDVDYDYPAYPVYGVYDSYYTPYLAPYYGYAPYSGAFLSFGWSHCYRPYYASYCGPYVRSYYSRCYTPFRYSSRWYGSYWGRSHWDHFSGRGYYGSHFGNRFSNRGPYGGFYNRSSRVSPGTRAIVGGSRGITRTSTYAGRSSPIVGGRLSGAQRRSENSLRYAPRARTDAGDGRSVFDRLRSTRDPRAAQRSSAANRSSEGSRSGTINRRNVSPSQGSRSGTINRRSTSPSQRSRSGTTNRRPASPKQDDRPRSFLAPNSSGGSSLADRLRTPAPGDSRTSGSLAERFQSMRRPVDRSSRSDSMADRSRASSSSLADRIRSSGRNSSLADRTRSSGRNSSLAERARSAPSRSAIGSRIGNSSRSQSLRSGGSSVRSRDFGSSRSRMSSRSGSSRPQIHRSSGGRSPSRGSGIRSGGRSRP